MVMSNLMLQNVSLVLLVRVWIPNLRESGGSTLQGELGARGFSLCVHMAPLWLGGVRGKNSTHNIG